MILKDLIDNADFKQVFRNLIDIYHSETNLHTKTSLESKYFIVFDKLQSTQPQFNNSDLYINVEKYFERGRNTSGDYFQTELFTWRVNGIDYNTKESYALEYCPWNEWLGIGIMENQVNNIGINAYIAHVLYEMTFISFDETDIEKSLDKLRDLVGEAENSPSVPFKFRNIEFNEDEC